ncbi:MAG: ATP synthase F0 subunit B [bacterium]|nr:ATP synthase F0 subunit B [bacterium]
MNFLVLVFLFRKFVGDQIVQQIEKRNALMEKLKKADDEYKKMIEFAHKESGLILEKAEKKRKELIHEAHLIAEEEKDKILKAAEHKAELIVEDSKLAMHRMETQLKEDWVQSVKETSKKVVKRLLKHNQELGDEYFGVLVEDVQK